ncbi:MAG: leucine-rich repeat domain-containing protein, partial [Kiritimatiellae bacterium]|nr:leucine-rich repeat domain-containing protein [Kiritimatiellia bacterium]
IPNSVTSIGNSAFNNCSSLASVTIPNSVTSIGNSAFNNCSSLASVTIPNSVTSIGNSAFNNCSSLASIGIGVSVESIGPGAFYGCSRLEDVMIPESVTNIHYNAFNLCENLQRFIVDQDNPAYASPDGTLCSKDLKTLIVYPRGRVDARLPDSLTAAMPDAFAGCNKLWMQWCKSINKISYDLTQQAGDRAIADVTVSGDTALDAFVLKEGKVYDSVLYISNTAGHEVRVTLPSMPQTAYKTFKGATPLTLPAYSTSILTITRVAAGNAGGNVFLVTREELENVQ